MALPIPGWPGYSVTDDGRVLSFWKQIPIPGKGSRVERVKEWRELHAFDRKDRRGKPSGYLSVCLARGGRSCNRYVHELVLIAWVGPRPSPDHEACHGDGNRANNALSNLRWGTYAENTEDRRKHGRIYSGEEHWRAVHRARREREASANDLEYGGDLAHAFSDLVGGDA